MTGVLAGGIKLLDCSDVLEVRIVVCVYGYQDISFRDFH